MEEKGRREDVLRREECRRDDGNKKYEMRRETAV
jgi:hypothetical protein